MMKPQELAVQINENEWFFPDDLIVHNDKEETLSVLESAPEDTVEENKDDKMS